MNIAIAVPAQAAPDPNYSEFILNQLRCASLRARLIAYEIDSVGVALKAGWLTPDDALAEVAEIGALGLVRGAHQ